MGVDFLTRDWAQFDPMAYLDEYYGDVGPENRALLQFLAEIYRDLPSGGIMLDFGGGPTIYPLISAADRVSEIHFSDFLEANREEVRRWLDRDPRAFDWRPFIRHAIELETGTACSDAAIAEREAGIRSKVTKLMHCDASRTPPIEGVSDQYDVIVTNFCAESATSEHEQWCQFVHNISSLLKPGGFIVMSALKGARSYSVGPNCFPAVEVSEDDLIELLEEVGFQKKTIDLRVVPADRPSRDYEGLLLAAARKDDAPVGRGA